MTRTLYNNVQEEDMCFHAVGRPINKTGIRLKKYWSYRNVVGL